MAAKDATSIGSNIVTGGSSHDEHNTGQRDAHRTKLASRLAIPLRTSESWRRRPASGAKMVPPEVTIFLGRPGDMPISAANLNRTGIA